MKKILMLILVIVSFAIFANADTIYLKNGQIIETERAWRQDGWVNYIKPDTTIEIVLSIKEEDVEQIEMTANFESAPRTIGVWFNDAIGEITIIKEGSNYFLEMRIKLPGYEKIVMKGTLITFNFNGKQAFKEVEDRVGEYFVIENSGDLGAYTSSGFFATMRKVK